jgi:hypothetical protein
VASLVYGWEELDSLLSFSLVFFWIHICFPNDSTFVSITRMDKL